MAESRGPTTINSGVEEEIYEFYWQIHKMKMVQRDELLLESQKFQIHTGKGTSLQLKWVVGFRNIENQKKYTVYCKMTELSSSNGADDLVASFSANVSISKGIWVLPVQLQKRVNVSEGFDLERYPNWLWSHSTKSWNGYQDGEGTVTIYTRLSLLKPLVSDSMLRDTDAAKEQLKLKSGKISEQNLACFLIFDSMEFDTKIVCSDGKEIKCHKAILSISSPVFKAMLESEFKEAKRGVLTVTDLSSKTVEILLQYLYTGVLQKSWQDSNVIVEFTYAVEKNQLQDLLKYLDSMLGKTGEDPATLMSLLELTNKMDFKNAEAQIMDRIVKLTNSAKKSCDLLLIFGSN